MKKIEELGVITAIINYPKKVLDYQTPLLADSMLTLYDWLYILKSIVVIYMHTAITITFSSKS